MTTEPLTLNLGAVEGESAVTVDAKAENASVGLARPRRRVPLFSRSDQLYYWTREWQESEAAADEEIRRGELRRFSDADEAMRWLDSPED